MIANFVPTAPLSILVGVVLNGLMVAFATASLVVFYFSSRCKHENFDLTVLAQAMSDEVMTEQAEMEAETQEV